MELIIGGSFQGKLEYVRKKLEKQNMDVKPQEILDCACLPGAALAKPLSAENCPGPAPRIINHLHLLVRSSMENGSMENGSMEALLPVLEQLLQENPAVTLICDEVGYGVVPAERFERQYREAVGRMLCFLAGRAEHVERIVGGLPIKIK